MIELLKEVAQRNLLEKSITELEILNNTIPVSIGILGEFNSGKSTLINAIMNERLLPTMDIPTTKAITEIDFVEGLESRQHFKKLADGQLIPIGQDEFRDIAFGKVEGIALLRTKANDVFKDGFRIIDTPGLSSLDRMDTDITYGYLYNLDGAVVCVDVNKGNLNEKIMNFLQKPELKDILNDFLFVLTHSSKKSSSSIESIKSAIIADLSDNKQIQIRDLESKIIAVDSEEALSGSRAFNLDNFKSAFERFIASRKSELIRSRIDKELIRVKSEILLVLEDRVSNFEYSDEELIEKEQELLKCIQSLDDKKWTESEKIRELKRKMEHDIRSILSGYSSEFASSNEETFSAISLKMLMQVEDAVNTLARNFLIAKIEISELGDLGHFTNNLNSLKRIFTEIEKFTELGKTVLTSVLTAVILPGSSAAATAIEATGGGLARVGSKKILEKTMKERAKEFGGKLLQTLAASIKEANPIEYLGDIVSSRIKKSNAEKILTILANDLPAGIWSRMSEFIEERILSPIELELQEMHNSIQIVRNERMESIEIQSKYRDQLQSDIKTLRNAE